MLVQFDSRGNGPPRYHSGVDDATEALIEACVSAGVAAERAHKTAIEAREQRARHGGHLTAADVEHLNKLEAAAERLSRSYVNAQFPRAPRRDRAPHRRAPAVKRYSRGG